MKKLILIGDSIRMGYQAAVIRELIGLADVWAPEQNGGNSANILKHLDEWVLRQSPDIVHINCGLHDLNAWCELSYSSNPSQMPQSE